MVLPNCNGHCDSLSDIGGTSCWSRLTGHHEPLLSGVPKLFEHPLNVDVDDALPGALETGLHVRQAGPRQKGMDCPHSDLHAHLGNRGNISYAQISVRIQKRNKAHTGVGAVSRTGLSSAMLSPYPLQTTLVHTPDLGHF